MAKLKFEQLFEPQIRADELMQQALTHRSASERHNERLEFLGDAVLDLLVAEFLYTKFPDITEGEMTRLRAYLVQGETLADIAREIDLSEWLVLGEGERKNQGQEKDSLLAGALEAIIGACYLLCGYGETVEVFDRLYNPRLECLPQAESLKDAKTKLQELLQARQLALPVYETIGTASQEFVVSCCIEAMAIRTEGRASSKRKAEQKAAAAALGRLDRS